MNLLADPLCKRYTVTLRHFFSKKKTVHEVSIVCQFWISGFYFTPFKRVLFTFPSRYLFTIGQRRIFRLWGWSPSLQARKFALLFFSRKKIVIQGFHLLWQDFSIFSEFFFFLKLYSLCLFQVRSPLLPESRLICNPLATKMFQFTKFHEFIRFPTWKSMDHKMFRFSP